ncbi:MAG: helix-turn-helix domain-containing protein [Candidatus Methylomirabilales bacterium]
MSREGARPFVMAAAWIRAGLPRHLSPTAVRVLLVIVAHADKTGRAWPSARRIGDLTGHSRTRVYRALQELEKIGFLQRSPQRARFRETNHPGPVVYVVRELDSTAAARLAKEAHRRPGWGEALRFKRLSRDVPAHETSQLNRDVPRLEASHHREISQDGGGKMSQDGTREMSQVQHRDVSSRGPQDVSALETQKGFKGVKEQREKALGFGKGVQGGGLDSPSREKTEEQRRKNLQGIRGLIEGIEERQRQERMGSA